MVVDLTADETRRLLAEVSAKLSGRELFDDLREPVGRYNPITRTHDAPSAERLSRHEQAAATATELRQQRSELESHLRFLASQAQRAQKAAAAPQAHETPLTEWIATSRDKTKRARLIMARLHREAVEKAVADGLDVPDYVRSDYPELTR